MHKEYIGDGCYVDYDGYSLVLTTSNGLDDTNQIVLEPEVFRALSEYADRVRREEENE